MSSEYSFLGGLLHNREIIFYNGKALELDKTKESLDSELNSFFPDLSPLVRVQGHHEGDGVVYAGVGVDDELPHCDILLSLSCCLLIFLFQE